GRWLVADRLAPDLLFEFCDQVGREAALVNGKSLVEPDACHLPVSGCRIFAGRTRSSFSICTDRSLRRRQMGKRFNVCQAKLHECGNLERAKFRNVPQSRPANVAIVRRVGQCPNADAIQYNPNYARKSGHLSVLDEFPVQPSTLYLGAKRKRRKG